MKELNDQQLENIVGGEALTLVAMMTVMATAIVAVVCYKLFVSSKGTTTIPGGWKFTWN